MKKQITYIIATIITLSSIKSIAQSSISFKDEFGYDYIAKELLKMEEEVSELSKDEFASMYSLLDSVIQYTSLRIKSLICDTTITERDRAIKILSTIEQSLTQLNFLTVIGTHTFSEGLVKTEFNESRCTIWREIKDRRPNDSTKYYRLNCPAIHGPNLFLTEENLSHFKTNPSKHYYKIDCDLGAILYVSIGQVNNLPIHLVEANGHDFVRYNYSNEAYVNWDNNSAQVFTDLEFQNGLSPSISSILTDEEVEKGHFLRNLSTKEIIAYHYVNTSRIATQYYNYKKALEHLELAVKLRPNSCIALNNLSWLYLTTIELKSDENYKRALSLSKRADELMPRNKINKDTYSCACAAVGKFKQAIKLGEIAGSSYYQINGYRKKRTCLDMGIK